MVFGAAGPAVGEAFQMRRSLPLDGPDQNSRPAQPGRSNPRRSMPRPPALRPLSSFRHDLSTAASPSEWPLMRAIRRVLLCLDPCSVFFTTDRCGQFATSQRYLPCSVAAALLCTFQTSVSAVPRLAEAWQPDVLVWHLALRT